MAATAEKHAREEMVGKAAVLTLKGKEAIRGTVSDVSKEGLCFIRESKEGKTGPTYYDWEDVETLDADDTPGDPRARERHHADERARGASEPTEKARRSEKQAAAHGTRDADDTKPSDEPGTAGLSERDVSGGRSRAAVHNALHEPAEPTKAEKREIEKLEAAGASHPEHPRPERHPETPDKPAKPQERGVNRTTQGGTKEEEEKAREQAKMGEPFDTEKDAPVKEPPVMIPGASAVGNMPVTVQGDDTPNRSAGDEMIITDRGITSISGRDVQDPSASEAQKKTKKDG